MIKVGLIGAGFMGAMHAECYAAIPNVKLTAVADRNPKNVKRVIEACGAKQFKNGEQLIANADVDMVDICLPTHMHCAHVILAARHGVDCLCEKPMARTLDESRRMVRAVKKSGITFMVAHVIRFWPEYILLKKFVAEKKLGRLLALSLTRVSPKPTWSWKNWLDNPLFSGSAILDLHIHDTDFVRYLCGEPNNVDTVGIKTRSGWEYVNTNFAYHNLSVSAEGGWNMPSKFPFEMAYRAVFEKGALTFSSALDPTVTLYRDKGSVTHPKAPQPATANKAAGGGNISSLGGYYNEIKHFTDCLKLGKKPTVVTPEDAAKSMALVNKEIKSAERKRKK